VSDSKRNGLWFAASRSMRANSAVKRRGSLSRMAGSNCSIRMEAPHSHLGLIDGGRPSFRGPFGGILCRHAACSLTNQELRRVSAAAYVCRPVYTAGAPLAFSPEPGEVAHKVR
jgi:hypothetical protein